MPEVARCSTDHSNWNIDKSNRTYIDPWDLENYVYMKRRLSMNVTSYPSDSTSYVQPDGEPITSLSAKSDFYYIKPPQPQKTMTVMPTHQIKNLRRQSLLQEVSAGIDEQHFSNELYHLYGTNENIKNNIINRCHHQNYQPKQIRRHSSITYSQYCQHQQQKQQQHQYQNYHLLQRYHQYPNPDDLHTTDSYYGSTVGMNSWQNYNNMRTPSRQSYQPHSIPHNYHLHNHDTSLSSSMTSSSTSPKPPQLLYLYQRRRMSQPPQISNNYRRRMMTPIITELNEREEHRIPPPHKNSISNTSSAPSGTINNNMVDGSQTETEDNDTMIYHDDANDTTDTEYNNTMNDHEIDIINDIINMRYRRISRQPKHFGLSTFGHLKIDYSCNWSNLDRYIGHS